MSEPRKLPYGFKVLPDGAGQFYIEGGAHFTRGIFNRWYPSREAAEAALIRWAKRNTGG